MGQMRFNTNCLLSILFSVYSDGSRAHHGPLEDISNSPLFFKPSVLKRKGFKSTAAAVTSNKGK